jgi:hypothetical protein
MFKRTTGVLVYRRAPVCIEAYFVSWLHSPGIDRQTDKEFADSQQMRGQGI